MKPTPLQRVASGDPKAFHEVIDVHAALVWSIARRFAPARIDPEDAVQEIFISIWDSAHRFNPSIASETAFVVTIARRRLIDMLRTSRPSAQVREPADHAPVTSSADRSERFDSALRAFAHLSPVQQEVLRLSIGASMSYPDIAAHLSIPLGTVKTHARRGLALLAEFLADREGAP